MKKAFETVLTPQQMRGYEQAAFSRGVDPLLLMEDAARALHSRLVPLMKSSACRRVLILCGTGNNGGDGMALGSLLLMEGYDTLLVAVGAPATDSAKTMRAYYDALGGKALDCDSEAALEEIMPQAAAFAPDCVVDAMFGTGFHGGVSGFYRSVIQWINGLDARVVLAVDISSGMNGADGTVDTDPVTGQPVCIRATHTVTLGCWKAGLFLTQVPECIGEPILAPIALPEPAPAADLRLIDSGAMEWLRERPVNAHKGQAGRVLMYMGSLGMAGAAAMAAKAALRAGAGLVTVACPREIIPVVQALVPNAMCLPAEELPERIPPHDVLAAGCGLGQSDEAKQRLAALLELEKGIAVLDADALNLLADTPMKLPERTVLTPHPGEAARLLGVSVKEVLADLAGSVKALAGRYHAVALLKGHVSLISDGQQTVIQRRGAPTLAKGGSGDALTGILAAICADPYACAMSEEHERLLHKTALASLWLGLAGKQAQRTWGDRSALTGDIIDLLPACRQQ
ncbi:MAG: NAD(P)H-hydrate dehydratase [Clostridia bacterium]|nr:NAD(P)H-hydrate dehydratase [Clostridia bacterium]